MLEKKQSQEIIILNVSVEIYFAGTQHRWKSPRIIQACNPEAIISYTDIFFRKETCSETHKTEE